MGYITEEHILLLRSLLGGIKRILEQKLILKLHALLRVNFPKAHNHFIQIQRFIIDNLNADPFILLPEFSLIVSSILENLILNQPVYVIQREAVFEFLVNPFLNNLLYYLKQMLIGSSPPQLPFHIIGAFNCLIRSLLIINPVNRIESITQNLERVRCMLYHPFSQILPDHASGQRQHKRQANYGQRDDDPVPAVLQDILQRNCNDRQPSVIHVIIVYPPVPVRQIPDG